MARKIKQLTKHHWLLYQYLTVECPDLCAFLDVFAPLWEKIYYHAYTSESVADFETEDGIKVRLTPYKLWELTFKPTIEMERSVYMLCCMGLLGIEEEDFCVRKEWIFYSLPKDFQVIEWYCKLLNSGIKKCKRRKSSFEWIRKNLENGCTSHQMVCGNGRVDSITVGNLGKLARIIL